MRVLGATSVACVGDVVRWSERVSRTAHVLRHGRSSWKTRRACSDRFSAGGARTNVGYRSDNGSDNARTIFLPAQEKAGTKFQVQHCRAARKRHELPVQALPRPGQRWRRNPELQGARPPPRLSRPQRPVPPCSTRPKDFLLTPLVLNFFPFRAGGGGGTEAQGRRGVR